MAVATAFDTVRWEIRFRDELVACGSAENYEEAFAYALEKSNHWIDWPDETTDAEVDMALAWETFTTPTVQVVAGFTISTGPIR